MGSEVLVLGRDSLVDDSAPTRGAVARKVFEHNPLVGAQRDVLLGGDHIGVGERGAEVRLDQVAGDGPVSLDGHDGVDVGLAVDDLAGGGHLSWQRVAGDGVRGGVAGRGWTR